MGRLFAFLVCLWAAPWSPLLAEPEFGPAYSTYGTPGLIDMPAAIMPPDGELALTVSHFAGQTRSTLTFQVLPRLTGSFRYAQLYDVSPSGDPANVVDFRFDRSFSLQYSLLEPQGRRPGFSIGLNDFLGTGFYGAEYIVATSQLTPRLRVTGGLGWGRLAGVGGFENPLAVLDPGLAVRGGRSPDTGGQLELDNLFRGDAAFFGGVEWQPTPGLRLVAEYSSDSYPNEAPFAFERRSPVNLGLSYALTEEITLAGQYLYGSEAGVRLTYALNPAEPPFPTGLGNAPLPVRDRARVGLPDWSPSTAADLRGNVAAVMAEQGVVLLSLEVEGAVATLGVENVEYVQAAQAVGRAARVLSRSLPPEVERFEIVLSERGMAVSQVLLSRADLEALEYSVDGAAASLSRAVITDPVAAPPPRPGLYPRVDWGIEPYLTPGLFDPDAPLRADVGVDLVALFEPVPGLRFSGSIRQRVLGNLADADRPSTSGLPRVRSEANLYAAAADTTIPRLTGAYYFRPGPALFARVTAGYLEPQFGGVSAELLWRKLDSRVAVGAEINYARQRDFDQLFGFRDYDVVTGHVSGYLDLGHGFHTQLDLGRYLAGDWGATLSLDREFENGWRVGAFATLTDVPFDDFGEGSFDKGIRVTIPVGWPTGRATRETASLTIRPVLRDGGARLDVDGRLYDLVRPSQRAELADGWGRFWQ